MIPTKNRKLNASGFLIIFDYWYFHCSELSCISAICL